MSAGSKPNDARREECQAAEAACEPSRRSERDSHESPVTPRGIFANLPVPVANAKKIGDKPLRGLSSVNDRNGPLRGSSPRFGR